MASITKRESGRWLATVRKRGEAGTKQVRRTFDRHDDAVGWAHKIESEIERDVWHGRAEPTAAERTTLGDALRRYAVERTSAHRGKVQELSVIQILCNTDVSREPLAAITSATISSMMMAWVALGYAPATISRRLAVLSALYAHAARAWGMTGLINPVQQAEKPKIRNERTRRVSDVEIDAVLAASGSVELPHYVRLALETAMRRGELIGLRWADIDTQRRIAHLANTKNGYPRDVPLSGRAMETLQRMTRRVDGRLFAVRADAVTLAWRRALHRARQDYEAECAKQGTEPDATYLVGIRVHDLRHEATSRLAMIFQAHELARITGHRDLRMIMRYYHPSAADFATRLADAGR